MTQGVFEQLVANVAANTEALNKLAQLFATTGVPVSAGQAQTTVTQTADPLLGGAGLGSVDPYAGVPASVDGDMIMALIQPHLGDEAFKASLGVTMRSLGIEQLQETPAEKMRPLYAAFAKLIASKPAPAATSII